MHVTLQGNHNQSIALLAPVAYGPLTVLHAPYGSDSYFIIYNFFINVKKLFFNTDVLCVFLPILDIHLIPCI